MTRSPYIATLPTSGPANDYLFWSASLGWEGAGCAEGCVSGSACDPSGDRVAPCVTLSMKKFQGSARALQACSKIEHQLDLTDEDKAKQKDEEMFIKQVGQGNTEWLQQFLGAATAIEARAMVNLKSGGHTALMLAIRRNYPNVTRLLLQYGADPAVSMEKKGERIKQPQIKYGSKFFSRQAPALDRDCRKSVGRKSAGRKSAGCRDTEGSFMATESASTITPLLLALNGGRPYIIRMVCEGMRATSRLGLRLPAPARPCSPT